jgi:hypothetical protein
MLVSSALFFHVRPANQPTITVVALCHEKFGGPCFRTRTVKCGTERDFV